MTTWRIETSAAGQRLDIFLARQVTQSRSSIQKLIKEGSVTVNGKKVTVHHFLKEGDEVRLETRDEGQETRPELPATSYQLPASLDIIGETKDWIVIDKPAGLLVHPDTKTKRGTLIDLLLAHDPSIGRVGGQPDRPGIVHRLDKEVSGLIVIAKNHAAYESLHKQFAERAVEKKYLALVHGEILQEEGDIKFAIGRSESKARMAARPKGSEGKAAWTHYTVKQRFVGATLLEITILSGRTHQIRAHLHALGHPVIGDTLYTLRRTDRNVKAPRLMLQSIGLSFDDPTSGKRESFQLDPDPSFRQLTTHF